MARKQIASAVVGALALLALAGCGWRLETEPDPFRTPSETTVLRDRVAAAEDAVSAAARASEGPLAEAEVINAPARITALGGVSPTSSPRASADLDAAIAGAIDAANACVEGAGDEQLGGVCASIALSHHVGGFAADPAPREPQARTIDPAAGLTPAGQTAVAADALAEVALAHDKARALYEVIAARGTGDERTDALARGRLHGERVAALLALPGVDDLTEPAYDVPAASVADTVARAGAARETEWALGETYAALLVAAAAEDRAWLANAAFDAYAAASPTPADVPALPGVAD